MVRAISGAARRRRLAAAVAAAASVALPAAGHACAVCYGNASGDVIDGTRLSVLFMLGLVYLLLGGGVGMFLLSRRHHRAARARASETRAPAP